MESKRAPRISKEPARAQTDENGGTEMGHADRDGDGEYPVAPVGTELGPRSNDVADRNSVWLRKAGGGTDKKETKGAAKGQAKVNFFCVLLVVIDQLPLFPEPTIH